MRSLKRTLTRRLDRLEQIGKELRGENDLMKLNDLINTHDEELSLSKLQIKKEIWTRGDLAVTDVSIQYVEPGGCPAGDPKHQYFVVFKKR